MPSFASSLADLGCGIELAGGAISKVIDQVNERIWVKETLKKANDYHANACVERSLMINEMKLAMKDEKEDDKYLVQDEEPVSTHPFSVLQQNGQELMLLYFTTILSKHTPCGSSLAPQYYLHDCPNLLLTVCFRCLEIYWNGSLYAGKD